MSNSSKKSDAFHHVHSNKSVPIKFFDRKDSPIHLSLQSDSSLEKILKNGRVDKIVEGIYSVCKFVVNKESKIKINRIIDDFKNDLEQLFPIPVALEYKQYKTIAQYHVALVNQLIRMIYTQPELMVDIVAKNKAIDEKIDTVEKFDVLRQVCKFVINTIVKEGEQCRGIIEASHDIPREHYIAIVLLACNWDKPKPSLGLTQ